MADVTERIDIARRGHRDDHPFAAGILTGAALGIVLGLLMAPRKGNELRGAIASKAKHAAQRCREAYDGTRHRVTDAARGTTRYVRGVADTVKRKMPHRARRAEEGSQATVERFNVSAR